MKAASGVPAASLARAVGVLLAVAMLGAQPVVGRIAAAMAAAQTATERQDYNAAADALAEVSARLPYSAYAQHRAGLAAISAGRFDAAIRHLHAAAALEGWTVTRRIALGDAYLGQDDLPGAIAQWEQALAESPEDDALLVRLARNYEASGRYGDAVRVLNTLARLRGSDAAVYYRLALLSAASTPLEAPARLALVAEIDPSLAPTLQVLLNAIQAGQATGDNAVVFALVGRAFEELGEWRLAEEALSRAVALNPEYADAYVYLGLAQDMQGKDGLDAYEHALALAPGSAVAQFYAGLYWRRFGDAGKALAHLEAAQRLDPENPAIAAEIGGAHASLGDLQAAEQWLSQAVTLAEHEARWWRLLARFALDNEYHIAEVGLPAARQAAGLEPDNADGADLLGYALVLTGDLANGQKLLERAVTLNPESASAYLHLGVLYARLGQHAQAEALLNHALALDPQGLYGNLAMQALARLPQ
jgi:tetratricopeptide (TPR) repeat protein